MITFNSFKELFKFSKDLEKYHMEELEKFKNCKKGILRISKIEGKNNEKYEIGYTRQGFTHGILIGERCYIGGSWSTSPIVSINEKDKIIETTYSKYRYDWIENENNI